MKTVGEKNGQRIVHRKVGGLGIVTGVVKIVDVDLGDLADRRRLLVNDGPTLHGCRRVVQVGGIVLPVEAIPILLSRIRGVRGCPHGSARLHW